MQIQSGTSFSNRVTSTSSVGVQKLNPANLETTKDTLSSFTEQNSKPAESKSKLGATPPLPSINTYSPPIPNRDSARTVARRAAEMSHHSLLMQKEEFKRLDPQYQQALLLIEQQDQALLHKGPITDPENLAKLAQEAEDLSGEMQAQSLASILAGDGSKSTEVAIETQSKTMRTSDTLETTQNQNNPSDSLGNGVGGSTKGESTNPPPVAGSVYTKNAINAYKEVVAQSLESTLKKEISNNQGEEAKAFESQSEYGKLLLNRASMSDEEAQAATAKDILNTVNKMMEQKKLTP